MMPRVRHSNEFTMLVLLVILAALVIFTAWDTSDRGPTA
jgi:hypothetical protein